MADFYHDSLLNLTNHHHHGLVSMMLDPNHSLNHSIAHDPGSSPAPDLDQQRDCFNATELEAVPSRWGQLFLIVLYTLTSLLALIGNVTVIVVEICGNESAHNIRKYLINLAISDIIIGVLCVPFTYTDFMLGQWIFPHVLCPLTQMVQLLSVFVTSLTLTFIGIERYLATLHPFSSLHHWLESHTHIMLALTWVFGACYAYIPFENTATRPFKLPTDNQTIYYECSYDNDVSIFKRRLFMTLNILLTFILPLFVLIFSYSAIMRKLIHDERRFRHSSQHAYGIKFKNTTNTNNTNQNSSGDGGENGNVANSSNNNSVSNANNNNNNKDNDPHRMGDSGTIQNDNNDKCDCSSENCKPKKMINDFPAKTTSTTTNELPLSSPEAEIIRPSIIDISDNNNNSNQRSILKSNQSNQQQLKLDQTTTTTTTTANNNINNNNSQLNTSNIDLRKSTPFNYRSKVRKTIKMMFTVILLYGICWMPIKLYQFLMDFGLIAYCTETELYAMVCLYFICHWMAMANSFVNPIIYSFMSKSFRNDFRKITQTFRQTLSKNLNQLSIKTTSTQV